MTAATAGSRLRTPGGGNAVAFAVKAAPCDRAARVLRFVAQKTMYGGKAIAAGADVFVFASENDGGDGLVARGVVISAVAVPPVAGKARQTPRVDIGLRPTAQAARRLGRAELRPFRHWHDGRPETELNFKLYRQATNKIVGLSDEATRFLDGCFEPRP